MILFNNSYVSIDREKRIITEASSNEKRLKEEKNDLIKGANKKVDEIKINRMGVN